VRQTNPHQAETLLAAGTLRCSRHHRSRVEPKGHDLFITGAAGKVQMVIETDGTKVTEYRAGLDPQIHLIEGCV
jgi:hypothetical protein